MNRIFWWEVIWLDLRRVYMMWVSEWFVSGDRRKSEHDWFQVSKDSPGDINILAERLAYEGHTQGMPKKLEEKRWKNGVIQVEKRESHRSWKIWKKSTERWPPDLSFGKSQGPLETIFLVVTKKLNCRWFKKKKRGGKEYRMYRPLLEELKIRRA